jgi:hypothetical protein
MRIFKEKANKVHMKKMPFIDLFQRLAQEYPSKLQSLWKSRLPQS